MKKIAITQRLIENNTYYEIRDCLDTNWLRVFHSLNIIPIIIPTGFNIENYHNSGIKLDGIILSGGNDLTIFDNNKLLSNLKRQSLRLSKHLEIPQNQAQILLAKHFYNENSFAEIRRKINSKNYSDILSLLFHFLQSLDLLFQICHSLLIGY
ncbi:MAG: hypothetical protein ACK4IX_17365 [Candidatus Sericytochromatia bacterium]